jgi:methylmalonyl-CoA mutase
MARNVQILLLEESNLWRVSDPASGAGYMEAYTSALCRAAWTVFQRCEAGIWPAPDPDAPWALPVIGTSAYRLAAEYPAEVEAPA